MVIQVSDALLITSAQVSDKETNQLCIDLDCDFNILNF